MGQQSLWYFRFYLTYTIAFAVEWIYLLVVTVYYGNSCNKGCPLITINVEAARNASLTVLPVAGSTQAVTSYYPCEASHDQVHRQCVMRHFVHLIHFTFVQLSRVVT